ncbi:MAG: hypothetical protein JWR15_1968 [Prosthecobacter sp.]|nr:hypothetical protein [Prosthecobacter sp.]
MSGAVLDTGKFHVTLKSVFDFLFIIVSLIQMLLHWRITISCVAGALLGMGMSLLIAHGVCSTVVFAVLALAGLVVGFVWDHRSTQGR